MANSTTLYVGDSGRTQVDVTEAKTLALSDNGIVQNVIADGITITLPATTAGANFIIRNGGVPASSSVGVGTGSDFSCLVTVAPNASDKIQGLAFSASDNKAALNTKATARVGDQINLIGDGTDGWNVGNGTKGIWARAAKNNLIQG